VFSLLHRNLSVFHSYYLYTVTYILEVIVTVKSSRCLLSTHRFWGPDHQLYLQLFDLTLSFDLQLFYLNNFHLSLRVLIRSVISTHKEGISTIKVQISTLKERISTLKEL